MDRPPGEAETAVAVEFRKDPDFMKMIDELKAKLAEARSGTRP